MKRNSSEIISFGMEKSKLKKIISSYLYDFLGNSLDGPTKKESDAIAEFLLSSKLFPTTLYKKMIPQIADMVNYAIDSIGDFEKLFEKCDAYQKLSARLLDQSKKEEAREIRVAKKILEVNGYSVSGPS